MKLPRAITWKTSAFVGLSGFLTMLYVGLWRDPSYIPSAQIGAAANSFILDRLDTDGRVKLADYRGKWVVLNFWASWCSACRTEHRALLNAGRQFSNNPKIQFLGVNFRDRKPNALRYLKREGDFPYPSGEDGRGRTGIDFGVYGLPETYFIDPQGKIVSRHVGAITKEIILENLKLALKEENNEP